MLYLLSKTLRLLTPRERAAFALAAAFFCISGIFVAWSAYYTATEEAPAQGGSFAEGIVGQPTFVNPLIAGDNEADYDAMELVFADLGDLTETVTENPGGKTWTIALKKNLAWDDGKPLDADDIVFTVETMQDPDNRSPKAGAWQGVIAEKISDTEIRFTLKDQYAFFGRILWSLKVAPQHIFSGIPVANMRLSKYNLEPVGSGPYSFASIATDKDGFVREMKLTANSRYAGKAPFIPSFSLKFYRTETAMKDDFDAKRIDGMGGISPALAEKIAIGHRLASLPLPRYYALFFNQSTHTALKEKVVRQALAGIIDRKQIIDAAFGGYAAAEYGPIPPSVEGYDESAYTGREVTREGVNAALDGAGWLVNPEDGVRYKTIGKDRTKLQLDVVVPDVPFLVTAIGVVKEQWATIGVRTNVIVMNSDDVARGALRTRNYQVLMYGNVLKGNPDVFSFWHSSRKFYPGLNLSLYGNKDVDALLEAVRAGTGGEAGRAVALARLQRIIADDAPAAFLFDPTYLYAVPTDLKGLSEVAPVSPADRLNGVANWYLKTERAFKK